MLAAGKEQRIEHALKQKMAQQSHMSSLYVDMLFSKARYVQKKATRTMKFHHTKLSQQVSAALELTTNNNCLTEIDVEAAFGCRRHTSTSEPYYWHVGY